MGVKERIIALRLLEKSEEYPRYFKEAGLTATMKTNAGYEGEKEWGNDPGAGAS